MKTKQILNTSNEAAKFVTDIKGFVDRHSRFFGNDKNGARWSGCTHIICSDCGKPTPKNFLRCNECREKRVVKRYKAMERKQWDEETPLYSDFLDTYFLSKDDLFDFMEDCRCTAESLRLIICEPIYLRQVDADYFCNELADDGELPSKVVEALDNLNEVIDTIKPVSWLPGEYAAICNL